MAGCGPDGQMWESQIIQSALSSAEKSPNGNGNMLEQLEEPEVLKTESRYGGIWSKSINIHLVRVFFRVTPIY